MAGAILCPSQDCQARTRPQSDFAFPNLLRTLGFCRQSLHPPALNLLRTFRPQRESGDEAVTSLMTVFLAKKRRFGQVARAHGEMV